MHRVHMGVAACSKSAMAAKQWARPMIFEEAEAAKESKERLVEEMMNPISHSVHL